MPTKKENQTAKRDQEPDGWSQLADTRNLQCFFQYINYDWDHDQDWLKIKGDHLQNKSQEEKEIVRRDYYKKYIDGSLQKDFYCQTEEQKKFFLVYSQYYSNLQSLATQKKNATQFERQVRTLKNILYGLFLATLPMKTSLLVWMIFLAAILCSFAEKFASRASKTSFWTTLFMEEEILNAFLLLFLIMMSSFLRLLIIASLVIWALVNVCEQACQALQVNPNIAGLCMFKSQFEAVSLNKVELIKIKSHLELAVGMLGSVLWLTGICAPLFPVFFMQYLRLKYAVSFFTRNSFLVLDEVATVVLPGSIYSLLVTRLIKPFISQFAQQANKSSNETVEQVQEAAEQIDNEPKIYEIDDDDLD